VAFLGDIADKRYCLLRSMLPFRGLPACLSVCLSRLCIVLKRQKIDTISLHTTAPCLSQIVLKSVYLLLPKFCQQIPCWFERRSYLTANFGRIVSLSAIVTMERRAYRKPPSLVRMVQSLTSDDPLPSKWGSQMHNARCRIVAKHNV